MAKQQAKIVILTGSGISAESGLRTFHDNNGLWEDHYIEDVATPEAFANNPCEVHAFYNARRRQLHDPAVQPNAAHLALARLEQALPGEVLIITQNVDNLHERAGSGAIIHMHGDLLRARCQNTGALIAQEGDIDAHAFCPVCGLPGCLRPHVVWFGEMPFGMLRIYEALAGCEHFISIGTSGVVFPAAGFVVEARDCGAATLELNLEASDQRRYFDSCRQGLATELVPPEVERLISLYS